MNHTITYNGKTITVYNDNDVNSNYISEVIGSKTIEHKLQDVHISLGTKTLSSWYNTFTVVDGEVIKVSQSIPVHNNEVYDKFYDIVYTGKVGDFVTRAGLNSISEQIYGLDCILYNPNNNYVAMQPITYTLDVTNTGVSVNIIDQSIDSDLAYIIDNGSDITLDSNEIPLSVGDYSITIIDRNNIYPFTKTFSIINE